MRPGQKIVTGTAGPVLAPAARHFCEPLRELGLSTADFRSRLATWRVEDDAPYLNRISPVEGGLSRPTAIHPGSGSARKNWPVDRWAEVIARLDPPILLVLGEAEVEAWNPPFLSGLRTRDGGRITPAQRAREVGGSGIEVASNLPLPELAAALARCRRFIGHDSGVSHLAAAVGTPSVLLFGPTDPAMWAPPGDHVRVIRRGPDIDAISVEDVMEALESL